VGGLELGILLLLSLSVQHSCRRRRVTRVVVVVVVVDDDETHERMTQSNWMPTTPFIQTDFLFCTKVPLARTARAQGWQVYGSRCYPPPPPQLNSTFEQNKRTVLLLQQLFAHIRMPRPKRRLRRRTMQKTV
jgi:hypothetical protein